MCCVWTVDIYVLQQGRSKSIFEHFPTKSTDNNKNKNKNNNNNNNKKKINNLNAQQNGIYFVTYTVPYSVHGI